MKCKKFIKNLKKLVNSIYYLFGILISIFILSPIIIIGTILDRLCDDKDEDE